MYAERGKDGVAREHYNDPSSRPQTARTSRSTDASSRRSYAVPHRSERSGEAGEGASYCDDILAATQGAKPHPGWWERLAKKSNSRPVTARTVRPGTAHTARTSTLDAPVWTQIAPLSYPKDSTKGHAPKSKSKPKPAPPAMDKKKMAPWNPKALRYDRLATGGLILKAHQAPSTARLFLKGSKDAREEQRPYHAKQAQWACTTRSRQERQEAMDKLQARWSEEMAQGGADFALEEHLMALRAKHPSAPATRPLQIPKDDVPYYEDVRRSRHSTRIPDLQEPVPSPFNIHGELLPHPHARGASMGQGCWKDEFDMTDEMRVGEWKDGVRQILEITARKTEANSQ